MNKTKDTAVAPRAPSFVFLFPCGFAMWAAARRRDPRAAAEVDLGKESERATLLATLKGFRPASASLALAPS